MELMSVQQATPLLIHSFFFGKGLAFGAVAVSAGVIGYSGKTALVTGVYMSAQRGSPTNYDSLGGFPLHRRQGM